ATAPYGMNTYERSTKCWPILVQTIFPVSWSTTKSTYLGMRSEVIMTIMVRLRVSLLVPSSARGWIYSGKHLSNSVKSWQRMGLMSNILNLIDPDWGRGHNNQGSELPK